MAAVQRGVPKVGRGSRSFSWKLVNWGEVSKAKFKAEKQG